MTIRKQAERLWIETFGDDETFVRRFFAQYYGKDNFFCIDQEGELKAMLFATPYTLRISGREYPACYLSGVCTKAQYRSHGLAKRLLETTIGRLRELNYAFAFLIAATPDLIRYYEWFDFMSVFSHREEIFIGNGVSGDCSACLEQANTINIADYQALASQRDNCVVHSAQSLALYQESGYSIYYLRSPKECLAMAICRKTTSQMQLLDLVGQSSQAQTQLLERLYAESSLPITYPDLALPSFTTPSPYMLLPLGSIPTPQRLFFNLLLDR